MGFDQISMLATNRVILSFGTLLISLHLVALYAVFTFFSSGITTEISCKPQEPLNTVINAKPLILMWSKYYAVKDDITEKLVVSGRTLDKTCCQDVTVTLNRTKIAEADVVVFYSYPGSMSRSDMPIRLSHQVWVLFGKESPTHSAILTPFNYQINWTMTYRKDSDVWNPYGYFKKKRNEESRVRMFDGKELSEWIVNKGKIVCAVISHCPTASKREKLIVSLRKAGLSVDVYGACGEHKICPRSNTTCDHNSFWKNLSSTYRFYFAAENSLCKDYITEKFWRPLQLGMVPLVYGGANYQNIAPLNSFIDARHFPALKKLANYLNWLSETPEEYAKYFEWRRNFDVIITDAWHGWCQLCKLTKLYAGNKEIFVRKNYENIQNWWLWRRSGTERISVCKIPSGNFSV